MPDFWLPVSLRNQESQFTCTPACVRMVLSYHGLDLPEAEVANLINTTLNGTLFEDVVGVAKLGFDVIIGNGSRSDLMEVISSGVPLITAVDSFLLPTYGPPGGPHCVVVAGVAASEVALFDPYRSTAPSIVPMTAFMLAWSRRNFKYARIKPLTKDADDADPR